MGAGFGRTWAEHLTELLSEREFQEHFCFPNSVTILLVDGDPPTTEKQFNNVIYFNKEQFNVELCFPLPSLFKQFLHFTKIPSVFLHLNAVRLLMGYSILDMLFHLDLSLLEVLFVYTIKMSQNGIFSLSTHIPSLQLVIGLLDSNKGGTKGHVLVWGLWCGLLEHLNQDFVPRRTLHIPSRIGYDFFCLSSVAY